MTQRHEGDLLARDARIAVVVSRFNDLITDRLVDAALQTYQRLGGDTDTPGSLAIAYVPGSLELPVTALKLAKTGRFDAIVCLGCIIRGDTEHYDHVASQAASGISRVAIETAIPTIFGVITADTLEQALERAGSKQGNQGAKAMLAAIEMVNLIKDIDRG